MSNFAEQYLKEKEKIEKETEQQPKPKSNRITTFKELERELEKYKSNQGANFNNVDWEKVVADENFTEQHMMMFQVLAQNHFETFVKNHKVSDKFIRKMYYDFMGVFSLSWLSDEDKDRIFPELIKEVRAK